MIVELNDIMEVTEDLTVVDSCLIDGIHWHGESPTILRSADGYFFWVLKIIETS